MGQFSMQIRGVNGSLLDAIQQRLIKRVDTLDKKVDDHETRLQLNERELQRGRHA